MLPTRGGSTLSLARWGFTRPDAAARLLTDAALAPLVADGDARESLLAALSLVIDPDRALLALVRLVERVRAGTPTLTWTSSASQPDLMVALGAPGPVRDRLLAVLGGSIPLGDALVAHPEQWRALTTAAEPTAASVRGDLLVAVGADPHARVPVSPLGREAGRDALRMAHRSRLLAIVGADLTAPDPAGVVDVVTRQLSDLADAALEAALALARALVPGAAHCRLAVIALGKCGGRELNYVSDVDVVYVVAPSTAVAPSTGTDGRTAAPGEGAPPELAEADQEISEAECLTVGARLATELALACSATTAQGVLWPVDANLRPEGRDGPLVRTLDSYLTYYRRWAQTWEFQALLKARAAAGDAVLGAAFTTEVEQLVWHAADRSDLVTGTQAMRRRVEDQVPAREVDRQLKLGRGGLRDVEFSVQLLQLVHGRTDPAVRAAGTLDALERLATYGYVGRHDAAQLDRDYRFLRVLEHRLQLRSLRRTHLLPTNPGDLRLLARAAHVAGGADGLLAAWADTRRRVRHRHEALFYRPLLAAVAALSTSDVRMSPSAARERLAALGYRDPAGALRHIEALSHGVSRRAAIQRQLLPVLLGWFAQGADPDDGLLSFRRISERLGGSHWYLKMLRDEGGAAQRMAGLVASSRLVSLGLERDVEATRWLGVDAEFDPRGRQELIARTRVALARQDDPAAAASLVRTLRGREILRTAMADVLHRLDGAGVRRALSAATAATLQVALDRATATITGGAPTARLAIIGMGHLGGAEMGYGSDADVIFVHDPLPGIDAGAAAEQALAVTTEVRRILASPGHDLPLELDARLRPDGRTGPLVPSLAACTDYYARHAQVWERQAMLRATTVAGDPDLGAAFLSVVDPLRYPAGGFPDASVREVRRLKARMEGERLPRGLDPRRHLKLGPGGLADVEWSVQLLQLCHAGDVPGLRTTSTMGALEAAVSAGLIGRLDASVLAQGWESAARARDVLMLVSGRASDVVPTEPRLLDGAARLLGHPPGSGGALLDDLRRSARRARGVVERVFYA